MKLQLIEWADHCSDGEDWVSVEDYAAVQYEPLICRSVGWVAREDDKHIALLANLDGNPKHRDDLKGFGAMIILKSCVVRRVTLKGV